MPRPILILAALRIEARAIALALKLQADGKGVWRSGPEIVPAVHLRLVGLRARRLPDESLAGASCVVMAGVAGGLDPALKTGQVILDDAAALAGAALIGLVSGRIHTSIDLVCTPAQKAALFAQTGSAVVDMEMDIVRQAALRAGIPLLGLRAVLDSADCALPPYLAQITDDIGRPRPLAMAGRILRHPSTILDLVRLGRQAKLALLALTRFIGPLVSQLSKSS